MNAIILAAGLGTRLRPLTDNTPKALVRIGEKTMLEHQILKLRGAGFNNIVINIHHFGEQIIEFLRENKNFGLNIKISDERDKILDTGGGIAQACTLFDNDNPILVHNVDIFSNINLTSVYEAGRDCDIMMVVEPPRSNRVLYFNDSSLCGWQNKASGEAIFINDTYSANEADERAFMGIHLIGKKGAERLRAVAGKSFPLIPFYLNELKEQKLMITEYLADKNIVRIDAGKPEALIQCEILIKEGVL